MHALANVLKAQGELAEAASLFREVLKAFSRVMGDDHPDTLGVKHNLAVVLEKNNQISEAESVIREVLEACRLVLGEGHPTTVTSVITLTRILEGQGRHDEAAPLYSQGIEDAEKTLPGEHPDLLMLRHHHGACLVELGRYEEAEEPLLASYHGLHAVPGQVMEERKEVLQCLVKLYEAWDKPKEAARYRGLLADVDPSSSK
jgi:tetratricopeptide (TPR) repeat protein